VTAPRRWPRIVNRSLSDLETNPDTLVLQLLCTGRRSHRRRRIVTVSWHPSDGQGVRLHALHEHSRDAGIAEGEDGQQRLSEVCPICSQTFETAAAELLQFVKDHGKPGHVVDLIIW
jgi:hypothetical protein